MESDGETSGDELIPDMDVKAPVGYYADEETVSSPDQTSLLQQLQTTKGKYKRVKRASFALLSFSAVLLVFILFFAFVAYTGSGILSDSENNPYLEDGNRTLSWMKPEIDPCEDFAGYAVGAWTDSVTLPKGAKQISLTFGTAQDNMREKLQSIVAARWPYLRPFYDSCLATPSSLPSATARMAPIAHWVMKISSAVDTGQLFIVIARMRWDSGLDVAFPFTTGPTINPKNSSRYLLSVEQRGFLLPAKAYYNEVDTITFYRGWIQQMFAQVGLPLDTTQANNMIAMETLLSGNTLDMEQQYDPYVTYNPIDRTALNLMVGGQVYGYFTALNLTNLPTTLDDVYYFTRLSSIMTDNNLETIKNLVLLHLFYQTFPYIDDQTRLVKTGLAAYIQGVNPSTKQQYCVDLTVSNLGMLVSHYYIVQYFDEANRNATADMFAALVVRYKTFISSWTWMDSATKAKALEKYDKLVLLLEHPVEWTNYDKLLASLQLPPFSSTLLLNNVLKLSLAYERKTAASIKLPVDLQVWSMDPVDINAYYNPAKNQVVVPAAMMEYPFFSATTLPYASRLAMLCAVLAHELWHLIDKSGAEYNANGILEDWQSTATRAGFETRVDCVAAQFSALTVDASHWLNGQLVAGEAMADLNGLTQVYEMLIQHLELTDASSDLEEKLVKDAYNNLTPQKVFFIKFAQLWAAKSSPGYDLALSRSDPHPPNKDRLLGTLRNMDGFANTFNCPVGSTYSLATKCSMR
jgi:putative endopeptidase